MANLNYRPYDLEKCELKSKSLLRASRLLNRFTGSAIFFEFFRNVAESLEN